MTPEHPAVSPTPPPASPLRATRRLSLVRALASVVLAMAAAAAATLVATPAQATISYLCEGYRGCSNDGMSASGYAQKSGTMWWRMYSGHNCTNYAAYRMVKSGMSTSRPWSGSGNASNWGYAMDHITNRTPRVGAIAWWKAYAPGAGSAGHVAYVEKVVSPTEIIVSQDSWGGDFSWARITASGSGWPSGFIHFNDVELRNVSAPIIHGTPRVGETLSSGGGAWRPGDVNRRYTWKADGVRVGARENSYTVQQADQGKRITVTVRATRVGYAGKTVTSQPTERVSTAGLEATSAPAITGEPVVGQTLSGVAPTWNVAPERVTYQWLSDGEPVPAATGRAFVPAPRHQGTRIRLRVSAYHEGYEPVTVTSPPTDPVAGGALVADTEPSITGRPRTGATLTLDPGSVTREAAATVQWLRDGEPIEGATQTTYQPVAADLATRISARVTWASSGYQSVETQAPATRPVKSPTQLAVRDWVNRRGVVRLRIAATAQDVAPVESQVVLRRGREVLARQDLVDGATTFRVRGLREGEHTFRVRLRGTPTTTRVLVVRAVRVP